MPQDKMPLVEALVKYKQKKRLSFHTPAHRDGYMAEETFLNLVGEKAFQIDTTEVPGLDDYHNPKTAIAEAQALAAELWNSHQSLFLINGTSSGLLAAICSVIKPGEKICVQRNSHQSVFNGLKLSGANPVYVYPSLDSGLSCFPGSIPLEEIRRVFETEKDIKALIIAHPTYYGVYSDLTEISKVAHQSGAVVIADEAHGAHTYFSPKMPGGALEAGADIAVQSIHKMVGSFTQSSIIHSKGPYVDHKRLKETVKMFQSTSPSYLLMASLDAARRKIAAVSQEQWIEHIHFLSRVRTEVNSGYGIQCIEVDNLDRSFVFSMDPMRLVLDGNQCGLSGVALMEILEEQYGISLEFADENYCIALVGIGTPQGDIKRLVQALKLISGEFRSTYGLITNKNAPLSRRRLDNQKEHIPELFPRHAFLSEWELVSLEDAADRISAGEIAIYPPGIPNVVSGERISPELVQYLQSQLRLGKRVSGIENGFVSVVKEKSIGQEESNVPVIF